MVGYNKIQHSGLSTTLPTNTTQTTTLTRLTKLHRTSRRLFLSLIITLLLQHSPTPTPPHKPKHRNIHHTVQSLFLLYTYIDTFILGITYNRVISKLNILSPTTKYIHHLSPLMNIPLYHLQIKLFLQIPEFTMKLFYSTLTETIIFWLLFIPGSLLLTIWLSIRRNKL